MRHDSTRRMLDDLRADARYVVIEANAVGGGADAFILAEFTDAAIVAIEVARTRRRDAADCLRRLGRLQTTVLGAAVVPASGRRRRRQVGPDADEAAVREVPAVALKARSLPVPERSHQNGTTLRDGQPHAPGGADPQARDEPAEADLEPDKNPADSTTGA
jgi:Mrp family chromosome partitioning ATPase